MTVTLTGRDQWELWALQALFPDATPARLAALRRRRRRWEELERAVLVDGRADLPRLLEDARAFLAERPGLLQGGVVATLHLGPYSLLPALLRWSGVVPGVLIDPDALGDVRPQAEEVCRALGLSPCVEWIVVGGRAFAARMVRVLRDGRPLVVFLDGNRGAGGMARTRQDGLPYHLPGRTIRVRTGVGRLVSRLGCPVRGACVTWRRDGTLRWRSERLRAGQGESPAAVTRRLYDWMFAEIRREPAQWSLLPSLAEAAECFRDERLAPPDPLTVRSRRRWFAMVLRHVPHLWQVAPRAELAVWEPGILVDRTGEAFYDADGLREEHLDLLRGERPATLSGLVEACGERWVLRHVLRLYQLGLVDLRPVS